MGDYKWTTYSETDAIAANFGKGLVALGQERYKNIVIFGETRAQWLIAAQACFKQNFCGTWVECAASELDFDLAVRSDTRLQNILVIGTIISLILFSVVTIYATLGEEAVAHGINETEVSFVITSHDLLPKFKTILKSTPKVKTIIYMEDQLSETNTSGMREDVNVIAFKEVIKKGASLTIGRLLLTGSR